MDLLLDTLTFLWFINDDARLSPSAARSIEDPAARVMVSVVTAWEITIKLSTGKLTLDRPLAQLWPESLAGNNFDALDVTSKHVLAVYPLPAPGSTRPSPAPSAHNRRSSFCCPFPWLCGSV